MSSSFETILEQEGTLVYTCRGRSMHPMVREKKDLVVIGRKPESLNKYDVVLLHRNGRYMLHRLVGANEDGYVTAGDHNGWTEKNVQDSEIVGVLTSFVRDGKEISVQHPGYRIYSRCILALFPVRRSLYVLRKAAGKVLK